jgi:hypothetical protein
MPKKIKRLTPEQTAAMPAFAQKWIEIGLCTKPADRARFEAAVAECYRQAKLAPPKAVIWVPNPLVGALAFPIAAYLIAMLKRSKAGEEVGTAVHTAVHNAVNTAVGNAVGNAVSTAVENAVRTAVGNAVGNAVDNAVDNAVRTAVDTAVNTAVGNAVGNAVDNAVDTAVHTAVHNAVNTAVRTAVDTAVGTAVHTAVRTAVRTAVGTAVGNAVDTAVRNAVLSIDTSADTGRAIRDTISKLWSYVFWGQFGVGWGWYWGNAYVAFFLDVCGLELEKHLEDAARAYAETAQSACWWWPHRDFVIVSERPRVIERDARGRLHRENGPAVEWDGFGVYSWHGLQVPSKVILDPKSITAADIDSEKNAEQRRVLIERYGFERYINESGARVIHEDKDELGHARQLVRKERAGDTPIVGVFVYNSTLEPDGTRRRFFLRVHPELRPLLGRNAQGVDQFGEPQVITCANACASTFGMTGEEYRLSVQT